MKLGTTLALAGLGIAVGSLCVAAGCDSDTTSATTTAGGKVPPPSSGTATTATDERVFAVDALFLGETDRAGNATGDAWKQYGYNLDGRITNVADPKAADLANVCKRAEGASATVHQDGDQGIDNSFGAQILKLLDPFISGPSKQLSDAIRDGVGTVLFKVTGLTDDPAQTNTGLSGTLLAGTRFSDDPTKKPTYTTADDWPYLVDPQVPITGAYVSSGVFVSGPTANPVELSLTIRGEAIRLRIAKAIITFKHDPASKALTDGTIAGVLDTAELVSGLARVAGRFSNELCAGQTLEGIKDSIGAASDILADGTQDPAKSCNGISVGLGFSAKAVGNPTKTTTQGAPSPDPCDPNALKDAGAD